MFKSKQMEDIKTPPGASRIFFAFSSCWMFCLAFQAWAVSVNLCFILTCCGIFSFLHWFYFRYNSLFSLLDRFFASLVFIYVFLRGSGLAHFVNAALSVTCFLLGNWALVQKVWDNHLAFHAAFRYFTFFMILGFIRPIGVFDTLICSTMYLLHYLIMNLWLIDEINAMRAGGYNPPTNKQG